MEFEIILPELLLLLIALTAQMLGIFTDKKYATGFILTSSVLLIIFILCHSIDSTRAAFGGSFIINKQLSIIKSILLGFIIMVMLLYQDSCHIANTKIKIEFFTLILLSTLGIFIAISSRNLLLLFCGLELQALTSYVLAAFNTQSLKSSEGALKYFILGSLLSAIGAFGISFIYGFGGSLDFATTQLTMINNPPNIGLIIGIILLLANIFFKLSAAPLHFWTLDVYEGSPLSAVSYFATASKLGSLAVLLNLLTYLVDDPLEFSASLIKLLAILSMIIGSLGALRQNSLKRLMAYGTILNIGYTLIAISLGNEQAYKAALINLFIYAISTIGFFSILVALLGEKSDVATFEDIRGAASSRKAISAGILIIMFSMIGIPPFAGFFGKYYVFYQVLIAREFTLVACALLTSVIASYYYLKVIKTLYFINREEEIERIPTRSGLLLVSVWSVGFVLLFTVFDSFAPF